MSLFCYSIFLFSILFLVVIRHSFYAAKLQKYFAYRFSIPSDVLFQAVLNLYFRSS